MTEITNEVAQDYLYHYTTIETLALILNYKTIRFARLDTVDDMLEGETIDINGFAKFMFVSCWTDNSSESIPLWGLSANNMSGVRIGLRKMPFNFYDGNETLPTHTPPRSQPFPQCTIVNFLHLSKMPNENLAFLRHQDTIKIIYTDDQVDLKPKIISQVALNGFEEALGSVGKYKTKAWEFQSEVRYRLMTRPFSWGPKRENIHYPEANMTLRYIDAPIRQDAFEGMQVMLGPKHNEAQKLIVSDLLNRYNPSCRAETSKLMIRNPLR